MVLAGGDGGRPAERAYADSMTGDYLNAVAATLSELRRLAVDMAVTQNAVSA